MFSGYRVFTFSVKFESHAHDVNYDAKVVVVSPDREWAARYARQLYESSALYIQVELVSETRVDALDFRLLIDSNYNPPIRTGLREDAPIRSNM